MTVQDQHEHYDGADEIASDPWGIIDRDNRNHRKKAELVMQTSAANPGDTVLEVGCGHGLHAQHYADRYEYTGIDISESLVAETRSRVDGSVIAANALDLPFGTDYVDAVVGGAILHHLPDPGRALREWCRVASHSVTIIEPNYLFPKDLITAHAVSAEEHKTMMAPWRIRETVADAPGEGSVTPCIYTPPWPAAAGPVYDKIDDAAGRLPGLRWLSQMLLIHIDVTA
jgi:SAM-dependent methyltransferase